MQHERKGWICRTKTGPGPLGALLVSALRDASTRAGRSRGKRLDRQSRRLACLLRGPNPNREGASQRAFCCVGATATPRSSPAGLLASFAAHLASTLPCVLSSTLLTQRESVHVTCARFHPTSVYGANNGATYELPTTRLFREAKMQRQHRNLLLLTRSGRPQAVGMQDRLEPKLRAVAAGIPPLERFKLGEFRAKFGTFPLEVLLISYANVADTDERRRAWSPVTGQAHAV